MLKQIRHSLIKRLWEHYREHSQQMQVIETELAKLGLAFPTLDHFAVIDLPGPHTGIKYLKSIFSMLGYITRGSDYLADKQNDFLWLAEEDSSGAPANSVLPQIVVADFRLSEMPAAVQNIIKAYSTQAKPFPFEQAEALVRRIEHGEIDLLPDLLTTIQKYFNGRDWPLPTVAEYKTVKAFNELLSWVLVHGRKPNHFTLSVHLLDTFKRLPDFLDFVESTAGLPLNRDGGLIKGGALAGIEQASTIGQTQTMQLADGQIEIATDFIEFVWRHPVSTTTVPTRWDDFFTGFVAQHADYVVESLYSADKP